MKLWMCLSHNTVKRIQALVKFFFGDSSHNNHICGGGYYSAHWNVQSACKRISKTIRRPYLPKEKPSVESAPFQNKARLDLVRRVVDIPKVVSYAVFGMFNTSKSLTLHTDPVQSESRLRRYGVTANLPFSDNGAVHSLYSP